jgi:mRNA interferase MazF
MKQGEIWLISPDSLNKLTKESFADCFQIRSLSEERFVNKIGRINSSNLEEIKEALSKVLSIEQY